VPVPPKIGNGQDPNSNLYWGNNYGVRSYFKNSRDWKLIKKQFIDSTKLERVVFKHASQNYYLVADAYNGKLIKQSIHDFMFSCSGQLKDTMHVNDQVIGINGNAVLMAYIGHDGLMDFRLADEFDAQPNAPQNFIALACESKQFFSSYIKHTKAYPLLWTKQLMCPEAYTLHDALAAYINNEPQQTVYQRAVSAYSKYQKCSIKESEGILTSGW
jgi:hypothetical protein